MQLMIYSVNSSWLSVSLWVRSTFYSSSYANVPAFCCGMSLALVRGATASLPVSETSFCPLSMVVSSLAGKVLKFTSFVSCSLLFAALPSITIWTTKTLWSSSNPIAIVRGVDHITSHVPDFEVYCIVYFKCPNALGQSVEIIFCAELSIVSFSICHVQQLIKLTRDCLF